MKRKKFNCPAEMTLHLIGGKWKIIAIWNLRKGPKHFGELRRRAPGVTPAMLSQALRELEDHGLVVRKQVSAKPLRVKYSLSELGLSLKPILYSLVKWGLAHQKRYALGEFGMAALASK